MKKSEVVVGTEVKCIDRVDGDYPKLGEVGVLLDNNTYSPRVRWHRKRKIWAMSILELEVN